MRLSVTVEGIPRPKGSYNSVRGKHAIAASKHLKGWSQYVAIMADIEWRKQGYKISERHTGPVLLTLLFAFPTPEKQTEAWPIGRADIDKIERAVLDALTHVWYEDDAQVVAVAKFKVYEVGAGRVSIEMNRLRRNECPGAEWAAGLLAKFVESVGEPSDGG